MATKFPPPEHKFIKARHQGGSQTPRAIVLHGTVSSDDRGTARNIADWWAGPTSPVSSAHYVVDPGEVIQCVGDHRVAYHCGYNDDSIGVEFCDEQTGPATRWRDADSNAILRRAARLVAQLCLAYDIAPVRPTTADLRRRGPHGIYGHNDSRLAFGNTTHTDPRDFPWAKFLRLVRLEIKAIASPAKPSSLVRFAHCSMQFSDSAAQVAQDADKLFARFEAKGTEVITGTEAAEKHVQAALQRAARVHGYRLHIGSSVWIAVRSNLIAGSWDQGYEPVLEAGASHTGRHADRGVAWVSFRTLQYGDLVVLASHLLTRGREGQPNEGLNRKMTQTIGRLARERGAGSAAVFYGGDQNIVDRIDDTFYGEPLTSAWDELGRYEDTGHGNIDVWASYDRDARVEAEWIHALDDSELFLHDDHFLVEGAYRIEHV